MALPLVVLSVPSIFIGYCSRDLFIGLGTDFWNNAIFVLPSALNAIDAEFISHFYKLLPVTLSIIGASSALLYYTFFSGDLYWLKTSTFGRKLYGFLNRKWFFDKVYNELLTQNFLSFGYHTSYKLIDRGIIEMLGPFGLSKTVLQKSKNIVGLQTGFIYDYTVWFVIVLLLFFLFLDFSESILFKMEVPLYFIFFVSLFFCVND
jgi:NADH-ubiquinone oxidoreductase chain 5